MADALVRTLQDRKENGERAGGEGQPQEIGVKDPVMTGTCAEASCGEQNKLVNVSAATV